MTANNHQVDDSYIHNLNGAFMSDTRAKAIENALESAINSGIKIEENYIMEKLLNIIEDPFCNLLLDNIFQTLEKEKKFDEEISNKESKK